MLETFKARLKAKAKTLGANLTQKRIDAYADRLHKKYPDLTEEADHDTHIEDLHELLDFVGVAKEDDRIRTLEANAKKGQDKKDGDDASGDDKGKKAEGDDAPAWAKSIIEANKALSEKLAAIEAEKTQSTIRTQIAQKLKDVPEQYWSRMALPQSAEEVEAFATQINQDWVNLGLSNSSKPVGASAGSGKPDEKELDSIVNNIL